MLMDIMTLLKEPSVLFTDISIARLREKNFIKAVDVSKETKTVITLNTSGKGSQLELPGKYWEMIT